MTDDVSVRCDNQHFVPAGVASCRRCGHDVASGVLTQTRPALRIVRAPASMPGALADAAPAADLLTMEEYTSHRNLLVVADLGVIVTCVGVIVAGVAALVPALVAGVLAGGFAALVLSVAGTRLGIEPGRAPLPATAVHARLLDRLLLAPAVAVIVTVLAVVVRAS